MNGYFQHPKTNSATSRLTKSLVVLFNIFVSHLAENRGKPFFR